MLVAQVVMWRVDQKCIWCVGDSHDMSNAFGSTNHHAMNTSTACLLRGEDLYFGYQRYQHSVISFESPEGELLLKTGAGGLMGDPFIVSNFVRSFAPALTAWQTRQREWDVDVRSLFVKCPFTSKPCDVSICVYADDIWKILIDPSCSLEGITNKIHASNEFLDVALAEPGGFT